MGIETMNAAITRRVLYCPACRVKLQCAYRQEVEIDYCPLCQAIWLQRGELNLIVERSNTASTAQLRAEPAHTPAQQQEGAYKRAVTVDGREHDPARSE